MKKLLLLFFTIAFLPTMAQNVNDKISIYFSKITEGSNYSGYYETVNFVISNNSESNLMMVKVSIYDYYNNSIVYYTSNFAADYLGPFQSRVFTYENNTGEQIIMPKGLVFEFQYFNMTTGGSLMTKKALKEANSISTNIPLKDISDPTGINVIENKDNEKDFFYDIKGRRVGNIGRGLYIFKGKKFMIK